MRMYHTDNLQLTPVNMPYGEYCFIANDSLLLDKLDKMHNKLSADGELEPIQNKWFYPEMVDSGIPSWIWYLTGFTVFCLLVLIYYNLSINIRERLINRTTQRRNNRLSLVLQTCHIKIWLYDVASNTFILTDRNGKPQRHFTSLEVSLYFKPADFERVCEAIRQITDMETKSVTLEINSNRNEDGIDGMGVGLLTLSVLRYEQGKPSVILGTINDITEERKRQQDIKERLVKYQSICNTAMVDMVFYDAEGYITGINDRCCITLNRNREQFLKDHVNVRDLFAQTDIDVSDLNLPLTTLLLNKEARLEKLESRKEKDVMYYEMQLVPVYDKNHNLIGAYGTGRDVSEKARSYHKLQKSIRNMQKANDRITKYINNINYVLDFSGTRQVSYSPEKHTLTVFKNQNIVQLSLTQSRCMTLIDDSCRKKAMRALSSMDNLTTHPVNIEVKTILRRKGMPVYLSFSFLPILDEKGVVTSYMGFCRDDSEIRATEQLLEKESARAQEVENLKNSFLRNMSYEIRTPLNSVVGFAELFEMPHTPEDEELFIAQIKGNSAHLLNLINDILFLSRLDAHMIEIKKQPTDFAMTFEGHCQIGWENHKKEGVRYITENHYDKLVVDIDDTNTGRIIEQIISNAAMFTQTGTVLGRYDYINGNLMIAIEDTGIGMPEKTLDHIFERFVSGSHKETTGLGLPICKELAEQMGGTLSINSEEGKGTSVWISIPCTALEIQRKKDI
jgi:signal transduction histidine kinase